MMMNYMKNMMDKIIQTLYRRRIRHVETDNYPSMETMEMGNIETDNYPSLRT
jgi:hypothetical protein